MPEIERPAGKRRRAVFVDRDGTLMPDLHYLAQPEAVELKAGVGEALSLLRQHGYRILCVTNQSGVERGLYTDETVHQIHARLNERLAGFRAKVDGFYYCPHLPETRCECRKPGIRLFRQAAEEWSIDFPASSIIGDRGADVAAGDRLGMFTVLTPEVGHVGLVAQELTDLKLVPDRRTDTFGSAATAVLARG